MRVVGGRKKVLGGGNMEWELLSFPRKSESERGKWIDTENGQVFFCYFLLLRIETWKVFQ